jgi:hypothetical protein
MARRRPDTKLMRLASLQCPCSAAANAASPFTMSIQRSGAPLRLPLLQEFQTVWIDGERASPFLHQHLAAQRLVEFGHCRLRENDGPSDGPSFHRSSMSE